MTPSTTNFDPFEIVLVPFPFTDQTGSKKRPAVVISSREYHQERPDLIIMAITSQIHHAIFGETPVHYWQNAGLLKPSVVKPVITTIEKQVTRGTIGRLHPQDIHALLANLHRVLNMEPK